ncbi:MAG TPA: metallophosphoesterase [Longimicrobium sp.]
MNRRRFLGAAAALGAAALGVDAAWWEPRSLEVTRHSLSLPPRHASLRFVQITDLHLRGIGSIHRRIATETARARPDFALLTGDSVDQEDALPTLDAFLALLDPRLPKYAILGNWEHWSGVDLRALAAVYERHNARLLVNESIVHPHTTGPVGITGLDDLVGAPDLRAALRGVDPALVRILLAHSPAYRDTVAAHANTAGAIPIDPVDVAGIRLMLSGHTHGGQVTVGGWAPLVPPGTGRYVRGWFRGDGAPPLYVSRGIGTSVLPIRFGATPELTVFTG